MRHERALASLALLKVLWDDQHRDHIDSFVPLLLILIRRRQWSKLPALSEVSRAFTEEWGLDIPLHAITTIANRCRTRRYLRRSFNELHVQKQLLAETADENTAKAAFSAIEGVVAAFQEFTQDQYNTELTVEQAQESMVSFLQDHDLEMLFAASRGTVLPSSKASKSYKFLFASFVQHAAAQHPPLFESLGAIAAGHILANAIAFSETPRFRGKLSKLRVYLDAPVIFQALGLASEEEQLATKELLDLLHQQGVQTLAFQHTVDEVQGILENAMKWLDNLTGYDASRASRALRHFVEREYKPSDVEEIINRLDLLLKSLRVEVAPTPDPQEHLRYQIDEQQFEDLILKNYRGTTARATLLLDIKSIASIYRLRRDRLPKNITDAKYVMSTSNQTLAATAREYEQQWATGSFFVPACITDVFLGTLVWLQAPSVAERLTSARLIADCQIAMEPSAALLQKYTRSVEALRARGEVTADEYLLLRTSRVARRLLEQHTLGDPDNFTIKTTEDILLEIKNEIKFEERRRADAEITVISGELAQSRSRAEEATASRRQMEANIDYAARVAAYWSMVVVFIFGVPLLVLLVAFTQSQSLDQIHPSLPFVARAVALALTALSLILPFNLMSVGKRIRVKIEAGIRRFLFGATRATGK